MTRKNYKVLSEQLRKIIRDSEMTQYAICKETGIDKAVLSKFVHGERGMSLESLDALGKCLLLEVKSNRKED